MSKKIEIGKYISNSSYFFEKENSRCYIINEKAHREFMLEGFVADLWYMILKTQDYDKVKEYAKSRGVEDELDFVIDELKQTGVIESDREVVYRYDGKVTPDMGEEEELSFQKTEWLRDNNFLGELVLELSYRCNLNCIHCYNDKSIPEKEMNFETAKKYIDEALELGVNCVHITSGECTIAKDFAKVVDYVREKRISYTFVTNGQELYDDEELFNKIVESSPNRVRLSLYSMDPEVHDAITGRKGSQYKTASVIRKLREKGVLVTINYFQLKLNKDSLDGIVKFKDEVGAALSVDSFFLDNKENNNSCVQATDEQLYDLYRNEKSPYHRLIYYKKPSCYKSDDSLACRNMKKFIVVSPTLEVFPCVAFKYKLGDLKEATLTNIWNDNYNKFMEVFRLKNLEGCRDCESYEYCVYCPAMAMYENGFLKKSDICCKLTKIRRDVLREINDKQKK